MYLMPAQYQTVAQGTQLFSPLQINEFIKLLINIIYSKLNYITTALFLATSKAIAMTSRNVSDIFKSTNVYLNSRIKILFHVFKLKSMQDYTKYK